MFERAASLRLLETALLVHSHEIEVIPRLYNLSVADPHNGHARKRDRSLSRGSSPELAFVLTTHGATRSDFVAFSNHVIDIDDHIWEGCAERCVKRREVCRTFNRLRRIIR